MNDLETYISNFRKHIFELGNVVTDEAVLWQFVKGLKPHLRKEVLKDPNLSTVSDAILIAEHLNTAENFSESFEQYKAKNKKYKEHILHDYTQLMDIGNISRNNNA